MSTQSDAAATGGLGISGALGVLFVALKLCGVIDWSWWWVTCPFWGGIAFVIVVALLFFGIWALVAFLKELRHRR